jgi:predicted nuclease with RNAse H fold
MRVVDRACAAAGYRPFPSLLPSMVNLTLRGIALAKYFYERGTVVIEVYPGMAQDILGIPRKGRGAAARIKLQRGLKRAGIKGIPRVRKVTHDELDAVTAALVGQLYLEGRAERWGPDGAFPLIAPQPVDS